MRSVHAIAADQVFDGDNVHRHTAVLIEEDSIVALVPVSEVPTAVTLSTLPAGAWLAPGFIDVQVNGGGDVLFNDTPTPSGLARIVAAHRRFGTTGLLATLISDSHQKMRTALDAVHGAGPSAGVLGIHFEGPFLSRERPGVHDPAMIRTPSAEDLALLMSSHTTTLVTLAPEVVPPGFIAQLTACGIRVALGHSMATYDQTRFALSQGLTGFTHLFNAMRPLESREPGPIAAALEAEDAFFGMIVDGAHVHPAMLRLALRGKAKPLLVTDAMPPVGGSQETFTLFGQAIKREGSSCIRADGRLAGSALDMACAVHNCVAMLDVPLTCALRYASTQVANFLGLGDRFGRLKPGYRADMVAFHAPAMRVIATWVAGRTSAGAAD